MSPEASPRRPLAWLDAFWVNPHWIAHDFEHQRRIDPFGHDVHAWLGALACLALAGPTTAAELGALPLAAAFLIRVHRHWRTWLGFWCQPLMLVALAWLTLGLASRAWTAGSAHAWATEFGSARFLLLAFMLWPVSDRRSLFLGALAVGFALGQLSQISHALGHVLHLPALTWHRLPGRNSGWWDPVVGGSLLTTILGLHLPPALWGRGGWRIAGLAGAGVTLLGVLATGSRGAWLASFGLIAVALLIAAWRERGRLLKPALALAIVVSLGAAIAWLTIGDQLRARFEAGRAEVAGAIERKEFTSDTGARLLLNWWAIQATAEHPIHGIGLGGFEAWARQHVIDQGIDPAARNFHAHAHNALLQAGATLGVPGLILASAFVVLAIRGSAVRQPGDGPPGYADGPCLALVGLLLVSTFDSVQVNSHTAALLCALLIFALQQRPEPAAWVTPAARPSAA
ncbi:MAG: O-antigen ligase family protein [Phycisphaerales bacterium]|nr:O-antigen ligase family protein [Phycisphaerales bacterium]